MNAPRWAGLPIAALILVAGVIGVQLANGGGTYEPLRSADACAERTVTSQAEGINGLAERLVLLGIDGAACELGVSREALTLQIAQSGARGDTEVDALRAGLLNAVRQMKADGTLPQASELVDEALDSANLNGLLEKAIRVIPDSAINKVLKTDDVLTRAINDLDLPELLANLDNQDDLEKQIEIAVTGAVEESVKARLSEML